MIEQISTSPFLTVSDYGKPYVASAGQSSGELRRNIDTQRIEAYNGVTWIPIGQHVNISLSSDAHAVMLWAQKKMYEEAELEKLMDKHPGVKDLKQKLDLMVALTRKEEKV